MTFYVQHSLSGGRCPSHAVFPQKRILPKDSINHHVPNWFFCWKAKTLCWLNFGSAPLSPNDPSTWVINWQMNHSTLTTPTILGLTHRGPRAVQKSKLICFFPFWTKEMDSTTNKTHGIITEGGKKRCLELGRSVICEAWWVPSASGMPRMVQRNYEKKRVQTWKEQHEFETSLSSCWAPPQSLIEQSMATLAYGWGLIGTSYFRQLNSGNLIRLVRFLANDSWSQQKLWQLQKITHSNYQ